MTGAYLRVKRDGKWLSIEIEHLTDLERQEIFSEQSADEILPWLNLLCTKLTDSERILNQLVEEGILCVGK